MMSSAAQFRPDPPPAMDTAEYTAAWNEVYSLGAKNSTTRTPEQTEIGYFWAYDIQQRGTPPALYNQILQTISAQQHNTVVQNARLFAMANVAMCDGGIACWDGKFTYDLWRPISGIRRADQDGNPDTTADPGWIPLGAPGDGFVSDFTPPFPAYASGHATFGGALFEVLKDFYGTNNIHFTLKSDDAPGVTRSFDHFLDAATENGRSRIYLGIHWNFDAVAGQQCGVHIGDYVFEHAFKPVSAPPAAPTAASAKPADSPDPTLIDVVS
jgi:hypothetical protein